MKTDFKSVLIGLAVGVLAMSVIGAGESSTNPIGRFQTAAGTGFFMTIDTATGQTWLANLSGTTNLRGIPPDFFDKRLDKCALGTEDSTSPIGRFQISGAWGFFVVTDTATGQTWSANTAEPGYNGIQKGFYEKKVH